MSLEIKGPGNHQGFTRREIVFLGSKVVALGGMFTNLFAGVGTQKTQGQIRPIREIVLPNKDDSTGRKSCKAGGLTALAVGASGVIASLFIQNPPGEISSPK